MKTVYFKVGDYFADNKKVCSEDNNCNDNSDNSTAEGSDDDSDSSVEDCKSFPDKIGAYSLEMRSKRILKYKSKIQKRRLDCPISKVFKGRS